MLAVAGESRCIGQQGLWDEGECLVEEYLHALCYKVGAMLYASM